MDPIHYLLFHLANYLCRTSQKFFFAITGLIAFHACSTHSRNRSRDADRIFLHFVNVFCHLQVIDSTVIEYDH